MGWIIKTVLGSLWGVLGSLFGVKQAEVLVRGQLGGAALETAAREAEARASVQREHVLAGWWWMTIPYLMIGGASAAYFTLIVADTIFGFAWNVEKLPPPFDATINQIILVTGGVSGGIGALGMILGRR